MRKVTKKQIINWLEATGVKEQFEKNHKVHMVRFSGGSEDDYSLDKYLSQFMKQVELGEIDAYKVISGAFVWSESPEGHDYWCEVRDRLKKWLDSPEDTSPVEDSSPSSSSTLSPEEIYQTFKEFLENHNISEQDFEYNMKVDFIRNSRGEKTMTLKDYVADQIRKYDSAKMLIMHGFVFSGTTQGTGVWAKTDLDWEEYCDEHNIQ